MLFSKDIKKACLYCVYAQDYTENELLCDKHGPVPCDHACRHFRYDPLRRTPPAPVRLGKKVNEESFKL